MNTEPMNLCEELTRGEDFNRKVVAPLADISAQYEGGHFGGSKASGRSFDLENHVFEYATLLLPMAFDIPRIDVGTTHGGTIAQIASGLKYAGNQWLRQSAARPRIVKLALDCLMLYGVLLTTMEPQPGYEIDYADGDDNTPIWPKWTRLPQEWFLWDPKAMEWDEALWKAHKVHATRDELLKIAENHPEDGWIVDAVKAACDDEDVRDSVLPTDNTPERNDFVYYEMWVPGEQIDPDRGPKQGYNGTIYTICKSVREIKGAAPAVSNAYQLREPRPFFGPRWGPYTVIGVYPALNQAVPMSPIQAVMGQVKELNDQARAANESARRYKRLVLVDSASTKLINDLVSQEHLTVVPVEGLNKDQIVEIEIGGISDQQFSLLIEARGRLDRISGMSDAIRGNTQSDTTATADAIAAQSSQSKIGFVRREFVNGIANAIKTACWYMFAEERFTITLDEAAAEELVGSPAVVEYEGGELGSEDGDDVIDPGWFDRMDFEIQPYSMDRTDEAQQQRNAMTAFQLVTSAAPQIRAFPELDWKRILGQLGDALNTPGFEDLVDIEMAKQIGQMQGLIAPQGSDPAQQNNQGRRIGTAALFGPQQRGATGAGGGQGPSRHVEGSQADGPAQAARAG